MSAITEVLDVASGIYDGAKQMIRGKTHWERFKGFLRSFTIALGGAVGGAAGFFLGGPAGAIAGALTAGSLVSAAWEYGPRLYNWVKGRSSKSSTQKARVHSSDADVIKGLDATYDVTHHVSHGVVAQELQELASNNKARQSKPKAEEGLVRATRPASVPRLTLGG